MQTEQHHVVVEDPKGEYWEGAIVDSTTAGVLSARGVVVLPVAAELFHVSAVGGYFKRAWGAGWPLPKHPGLSCPMLLFVTQRQTAVHWVARLVRDVESDERANFNGLVRLTPDSTQALAQRPGFVADDREPAFDLSTLGPEREDGGWLIRGRAKVFAPSDGYMGLALYGAGPGLRVAWAAVSLA